MDAKECKVEYLSVDELFKQIKEEDPVYARWSDLKGPLASFLFDLDMIQGWNDVQLKGKILGQIDIRKDPKYSVLKKASELAGGELFITPLGKYSITLPYDLRGIVDLMASNEGKTVEEILRNVLYRALLGVPTEGQGDNSDGK